MDHHLEAASHRGWVHDCRVAGDHAVGFQPADPAQAGGGGQPYLAARSWLVSRPLHRPPDTDRAEAARETWVIWLGLFALGIGFGVLVTSHGFPWWLAPVISASMSPLEFILISSPRPPSRLAHHLLYSPTV